LLYTRSFVKLYEVFKHKKPYNDFKTLDKNTYLKLTRHQDGDYISLVYYRTTILHVYEDDSVVFNGIGHYKHRSTMDRLRQHCPLGIIKQKLFTPGTISYVFHALLRQPNASNNEVVVPIVPFIRYREDILNEFFGPLIAYDSRNLALATHKYVNSFCRRLASNKLNLSQTYPIEPPVSFETARQIVLNKDFNSTYCIRLATYILGAKDCEQLDKSNAWKYQGRSPKDPDKAVQWLEMHLKHNTSRPYIPMHSVASTLLDHLLKCLWFAGNPVKDNT
jgi:hypothetical protein